MKMVGIFASLLLKSAFVLAIGSSGALDLQTENETSQRRNNNSVSDIDVNQTYLVDTSNSFGLRIYKEYLGSNADVGNVIFSPFSLASALYMLLEGAGGKTYSEIKSALGPDARRSLTIRRIEKGIKELAKKLPLNGEGYTLNIANSLWVKRGFSLEPKFKNKLNNIFSAEASDVDFAKDATERINEWCDVATNHSIPQLFNSPLDPNTTLVLINAIYFKGVWKTPFDPRMTYDGRFFINNDEAWEDAPLVRTMSMVSEFALAHNRELGFKLLTLPYENDEVAMYVLLPDKEVLLENIESEFTYQILQDAITNSTEVKVDVTLPKFKLNNELSLIPALNRVGINRVFGNFANLSKINQRAQLKVSKVIQKAVIEVNEQGTVAAAASGIAITTRSKKHGLIEFHADRPFMFFIQHARSGLILFAGRVTNP